MIGCPTKLRNTVAAGLLATALLPAQDRAKAIAYYDQALKLRPDWAEGYNRRGAEHFKMGHIQQSLDDFDHAIRLEPGQAPYHWQRGISLYYAGRYEDGRKQFELHRTVNPNDVENAVWR